MRDWRSRRSKLRAIGKDTVLSAAQMLGRFEPYEAADKGAVQTSAVPFFGERPGSGALGALEEHRIAFSKPRPYCENAFGLSYSPSGIAWVNGRIVEKYCIRRPSVAEILTRPPRSPKKRISLATIVEADIPYSYGDWLHCYLGNILTAANLVKGPVLVPAVLYRKSYVRRDLAIAQVDCQPVEDWTAIEKALVLRKRNFGFIWDQEYCKGFLSKFAPVRPDPERGSLTYFARRDGPSEAITRSFPTEIIASVVEELGGTVVDQSHFSPEFAKQIAPSCDIVIIDHGSGGTNIMYWKSSLVIELFVDQWWNHNNLFISDALKVSKHAVLDVEGLSANEFRQKLEAVFLWAGVPFPPSKS